MRIRSILKFISPFVKYKLGRTKLTYVVYFCTGRCNLRCLFCDWWRRDVDELGSGEALRVIKELADFGVSVIGFSGGEPTLRKDLEKLSSAARSFGMLTTLSTNGTMVNRERARKIGRSFDIVNVSLDGFRELHDYTRGVDGTYELAVKGIKNLRETEAKLGICLTIYKRNFHQVLPLFLSFRGLVDFVSFQPILPYPPSPEVSLTSEEAEAITENLLTLKEKEPSYVGPLEAFIGMLKPYFSQNLPRICDAGSLYAMLEPDGSLLACDSIRERYYIGNMRKESLEDLWNSERRLQALRALSKCRGCLSQCQTLLSMAHRGMITLRDVRGAVRAGL